MGQAGKMGGAGMDGPDGSKVQAGVGRRGTEAAAQEETPRGQHSLFSHALWDLANLEASRRVSTRMDHLPNLGSWSHPDHPPPGAALHRHASGEGQGLLMASGLVPLCELG